jgi:hypothetical protein
VLWWWERGPLTSPCRPILCRHHVGHSAQETRKGEGRGGEVGRKSEWAGGCVGPHGCGSSSPSPTSFVERARNPLSGILTLFSLGYLFWRRFLVPSFLPSFLRWRKSRGGWNV